jgi:predicted RNA-binding Zn-ribbon protein involved in translation (DUF1610 family)
MDAHVIAQVGITLAGVWFVVKWIVFVVLVLLTSACVGITIATRQAPGCALFIAIAACLMGALACTVFHLGGLGGRGAWWAAFVVLAGLTVYGVAVTISMVFQETDLAATPFVGTASFLLGAATWAVGHYGISQLGWLTPVQWAFVGGTILLPFVVASVVLRRPLSSFEPPPEPEPSKHLVGKECSNCHAAVSVTMKAGDLCPRCGVRWAHESSRSLGSRYSLDLFGKSRELDPAEKRRRWAFGLAVLVLVIMIVVAVCGWCWGKASEEKPVQQPVPAVTESKLADAVPEPTVHPKTGREPVTKVVPDQQTIPPSEPKLVEKPGPPLPRSQSKLAPPPEYRIWTDVTDKYRTEAAFAGVASNKVALNRRDGSTIHVPLAKLSKEDRQWIEDHEKSRPDKRP